MEMESKERRASEGGVPEVLTYIREERGHEYHRRQRIPHTKETVTTLSDTIVRFITRG
jgi:hypothetical protein